MTIIEAFSVVWKISAVRKSIKETDAEMFKLQSTLFHKKSDFIKLKNLVKSTKTLIKKEIFNLATKNLDKIEDAVDEFVKNDFDDYNIEDFEID